MIVPLLLNYFFFGLATFVQIGVAQKEIPATLNIFGLETLGIYKVDVVYGFTLLSYGFGVACGGQVYRMIAPISRGIEKVLIGKNSILNFILSDADDLAKASKQKVKVQEAAKPANDGAQKAEAQGNTGGQNNKSGKKNKNKRKNKKKGRE